MMEVQEDEEEAPEKRQGLAYTHTHPHTTKCKDCGLCTCNCCTAAVDHMDESEGGPSSTSQHQPPLRRSTRPKKPQIAPIDECSWRQAQEQGSFCPRSCLGHQGASCTNQLPIWETETWVHLRHTPGLVSNSRPLKASRFIPKGTRFT